MSRNQSTRGIPLFQEGDCIGYAAKFLRNTGQFTGAAPQRRGTFVKFEPPYCGTQITHGRVHWNDEDELIASKNGNYAEQDYCDDVKCNGALVALSAIAKVGSARFVLNDI